MAQEKEKQDYTLTSGYSWGAGGQNGRSVERDIKECELIIQKVYLSLLIVIKQYKIIQRVYFSLLNRFYPCPLSR